MAEIDFLSIIIEVVISMVLEKAVKWIQRMYNEKKKRKD